MNAKLCKTLTRIAALILILAMLPSGLGLADTGTHPEPAMPFEGEVNTGEESESELVLSASFAPEADVMRLLAGGSVFQNGADRLAALQNNDGGWDWELDDGDPASVSPKNTISPIGRGLAEAYLHTNDPDHLSALTDAGTLLLAKSHNFSPSDGYLAATLDEIFGGTTYTDYVVANFYAPLDEGTYTRIGDTTLYTTAAYVQRIRTVRSGTQANMAAWDIGMGLVGAAAVDADTSAWIAGTKAEIDELDGDNYYDVIGLAGALYGLAYVDEPFDPTAGEHEAANDLTDLGAILASYQISSGGFAWNSAYVIPDDGNETVQETSYAILALSELDRTAYLSTIQAAADYLQSVQLGTGGWAGDVLSGENNEITGEALWAISTVYPELWVCPSGDCGHPGFGFNTIQAAIDEAGAGATIYVFPGEYDETASGRTVLAGTPVAQGPHQFGLFFPNSKPGLSLVGVDDTGAPITNPNSPDLPYITTNATNNFGTSGIWVEGDDVTIQGVEIGPNIPGDNKTIEIVADGFTLKYSDFSIQYGGSVYFGDWQYDAVTGTSAIESYTIDHNLFDDGTQVAISSGAGYSGPVAGRLITNNVFAMAGANDPDPTNWPGISFNGIVPSVGWFVNPVGGAVITGNTFSGSTQYIRSRGTVDAADFDWASYWNNNTFDKKVMAGPNPPAEPRAYTYMSGTYSMTNTKVIGSVIPDEIGHAEPGDTVLVGAGTYVLSGELALNKAITLQGQGNPLIQVSGTGFRFNISAPGVTLSGLKIEKTDKTGEQNIIYIGASNTSITNNEIFGKFVIGDGETSRGMVLTGGLTGLNISGNTIHNLRQPAYISGVDTGTISNNYVYSTKGWVVEGGNLTFTNNTWGTGANANVFDIAILALVGPSYYTDIPAMAAANHGAFIEDQRTTPFTLSTVYVDGSVGASGTGTATSPVKTIAEGVTRVVAGGTIHVAEGTYPTGQIAISKNMSILGDPANKPVIQPNASFTGNNAGNAWLLVNSGVTFNLSDVVVDGTGFNVWQALRSHGATTVNRVDFRNIKDSGNPYFGVAVDTFGGIVSGGTGSDTHGGAGGPASTLTVTDSTFTNIGRIGVLVKGTLATATITGNTYTGKGAGDWLDYAFEVGAGGHAVITGNSVTSNRGETTNDGSTSAAILVTTYWGAGTNATIENNTFTGNTSAMAVGYDASDTSVVVAHHNKFIGSTDVAVNSTAATVNATENWWGSANPVWASTVSDHVSYIPWCGDAACSFLVSPPAAFGKSAPVNGASGLSSNVTLSWDASSDATRYEYCLSLSAGSCTSWVNRGTKPYAYLSGLTPGTTYFWQVRAVNSFGTTYADGANTAHWTFTTGSTPAAFNKTTPTNGASGLSNNVSLYWEASSGAVSYEYCFSTSAAGCTTWVTRGNKLYAYMSGLTPSTTYFWQVRARNSSGFTYANGAATAVWSFTTGAVPGAFNKTNPLDGATGQSNNLSLIWGASSGAANYEYCFSTTAEGCTTWINRGNKLNVYITDLTPNTTYFWQVRAKNSNGITYANGAATAVWSFTTGAVPGAFNKTNPLDGATGLATNPTLYWQASSGAASYEYCIGTSATTCTTWVTRGNKLYVYLTGLTHNTTYFWHVRARNGLGITYSNGAETARWSFTTAP